MRGSLSQFDSATRRFVAESLLEGAASEDVIECLSNANQLDVDQATELVAELRTDSSFQAASVLAARLRSREWWLRTCAVLASASDADSVDECSEIASAEFLDRYYFRNRALMIRGLARSWRATTDWSPEYLKRRAGHAQVEVMVNRAAAQVWNQNTAQDLRKVVSFAQFVDRVFSGQTSNDYYLVSRNRFFAQPEAQVLLDDLAPPDFIRVTDPGESVRMWFGPQGTVTKLHYDDRNVLLVQLKGGKAVTLFAPCYSYAMKQEMPWYSGAELDEIAEESPTPRRVDVQLRAGDVLFIPVGWWHEVTALDPSITLTFKEFSVANDYGQP